MQIQPQLNQSTNKRSKAMSKFYHPNLLDEQNQTIDKFQKSLPDKPVDIVKLAKEGFGLEVWHATLPPKISGMILKEDNGKYAIYSNRKDLKVRRRFTYAHELAHFLLHKEHIGDGLRENPLFRSTLSNQQEIEANKLAADILMPLPILNDLAETQEYGVNDLAKIFDVSRSAMLIRLGIPD